MDQQIAKTGRMGGETSFTPEFLDHFEITHVKIVDALAGIPGMLLCYVDYSRRHLGTHQEFEDAKIAARAADEAVRVEYEMELLDPMTLLQAQKNVENAILAARNNA
jgi:hypothetical protein